MGTVGFVGLLTICLIVLKLTGHIDIGWIWAFSPIWLSLIIYGVIVAAAAGIATLFSRRRL